jgi:hypothetical protein
VCPIESVMCCFGFSVKYGIFEFLRHRLIDGVSEWL